MKKLLFSALIFVSALSIVIPSYAYADSFSLSDPKGTAQKAMDGIMEMFGASQEETKNAVQSMNVYRQKQIPPQVSLEFAPSSPLPGEKVTVTASPTYFLNDPSQMYFTWFLKHDYCKTADKSDDSYNSKCDLNDDARVNIEDYKIEAMRISAGGGFEWQKADYSKDTDDDGYKAILGGQDKKGMPAHCYYHDFTSGNEYELSDCKHLFPDAPGHETGDGSFGGDEEKFWRTDPNNQSTANNSNMDEANVAGLGASAFAWNYQPGDKIGVAVEGISVQPTQYADSSYKIMWALPKNTCDIGDSLASVPTGGTTTTTVESVDPNTQTKTRVETTVVKTVTDNSITAVSSTVTQTTVVTKNYLAEETFPGSGIFTYPGYPDDPDSTNTTTTSNTDTESRFKMAVNDLDDCLEKNLVEPAEGGESKKLDISLSSLPDSPNNDTSDSGANSDELIIHSSVLNYSNAEFINYAWKISLGDSLNPDTWNELTKADLTDQAGVQQTSGLGLKSLKLKLNFKKSFLSDLGIKNSDVFYLKVRLDASENVSSDLKKTGNSESIIPIHLSSIAIKAYPVKVDNNLNLSLDTTAEKCSSGLTKVVCPVAKDEIVGVRADVDPTKFDILWTVNGEALPFMGKCSTDKCDASGNYSNVNYFPVLQDKGSRYTVNMTASNKTTGEKITLIKVFEVADPSVQIVSDDKKTCQPIILGNYVDLDGKLWPDYSTNHFEAVQGSTIVLKPNFNTISLADYSWTLDGTEITSDNAVSLGATLASDGSLSFTASKNSGESYNVGLVSLYAQDNATKKVLNKNWDVSLADFYEKQIGTSVEINVVDSLSGASSAYQSSRQKVLASLFAGIPAYIMFLFRIVLTVAVILGSAAILFALFPKNKEEDNYE